MMSAWENPFNTAAWCGAALLFMPQDLDARHLLCPMPVIRTQQAVAAMRSGEVLRVRCTDPGVRHDIPAWCEVHGHRLLGIQESGDEVVVTLEVVAS